MQAPYFYTAANVARVNLAMEIPADTVQFNKDKGKYHANLNVLGIAYRSDGIGGRALQRHRQPGSRERRLERVHQDSLSLRKSIRRHSRHLQTYRGAQRRRRRLRKIRNASANRCLRRKTVQPRKRGPDRLRAALGRYSHQSRFRVCSKIALPWSCRECRLPLRDPIASSATKTSFLYSEIYAPLLTSENPPKVGLGYRIFDRATNKEVFFTGVISADGYIQKGNPIVPVGLKVKRQGPALRAAIV